ncbi:hypothetical protein [Conexibacter sp. S30A1]|uniref:hypothetical protein n=1 Tax=Conexibacter sp. S30A1 TaxID=2937800 RepID=UPI00200E5F77|nr:hypothetical protein [Conexibacter sp. S30A1]
MAPALLGALGPFYEPEAMSALPVTATPGGSTPAGSAPPGLLRQFTRNWHD